ncbi:hypothetical protein Acy02nite_47320 [Actinoplanes cyaneus]|uniref:STAS domain-containing protein n=1 Tax=Actinoplanes cyaneus TaxID=52696 RepID=A0A919ILK5_9ACTN|nr:hypothetical protein Acy02nite_47320 [Actinoplanes cyaneus]
MQRLSGPLRRSRVTGSHVAVCPSADIADQVAAVVEIAVHGSWSHTLGLDVSAALRDAFAGRPAAIIVNLHGLSDDEATSLPLWLAARRAAAVIRPPVRLALCLPTATVLQQRLQYIGAQRLPMYATMPEARTAVAHPRIT